jgi:hypothetical protein
VADTVFDSAISYDLRFFQALDRMVQVEPLQTKDKVMTDLLKSIGIEKGKPFNPDPKTAEILAAAAQEAHAWCEDRWLSVLSPYYPGRQWLMPAEPIGPESNATFETADFYATDARGMSFYWVYGAPKHLGGGTFYLLGVRDKDRQLLRGESNYRLTIPARVPA